MMAFMPQCVALPSAWPRDRTAVGKISAQIDPDHRALRDREERDEQRSATRAGTALPCPVPMMTATPASAIAVPTEPMSSSFLRPTRSITRSAMMVAMRLAAPMATCCRSFDKPLKPRGREDVLEVIEDRVDARELVERRDAAAPARWACGRRRRTAAPPGCDARARPRARTPRASHRRRSTPTRARLAFASSCRPRCASQRGLCGMVYIMTKNTSAGTAAMPSFRRHGSAPPTNCCTSALLANAITMPSTMLNWNSPVSLPRRRPARSRRCRPARAPTRRRSRDRR